jgi:hypothetical protein
MPPTSIEDTMITAQPPQRTDLLFVAADEPVEQDGVLERCRATFRALGERVTSFDLSRHIYG